MLTWSLVYLALSAGTALSGALSLARNAQEIASILFINFTALALFNFIAWVYRLRLGEITLRNWADWQPVRISAATE